MTPFPTRMDRRAAERDAAHPAAIDADLARLAVRCTEMRTGSADADRLLLTLAEQITDMRQDALAEALTLLDEPARRERERAGDVAWERECEWQRRETARVRA